MTTASGEVIRLERVIKTFPSEPPVLALDEVDLVVSAGDQLAVVGPSGSGKSTLLNVIGCLDRPTSGRYRLDGVDVDGLDDGALARLRCEKIGFVVQSFHLLDPRTVEDNVALGQLYDRRSTVDGHRPHDATPPGRSTCSLRSPRPPARLPAQSALRRGTSAGGDRTGVDGVPGAALVRRTHRQPRLFQHRVDPGPFRRTPRRRAHARDHHPRPRRRRAGDPPSRNARRALL